MKLPKAAPHPGESLGRKLKACGLTAAEFARSIRVPLNRVTRIINAQRSMSADTAIRAAHYFGTTPEFWLNLQACYDLGVAARKAGRKILKLPKLQRR